MRVTGVKATFPSGIFLALFLAVFLATARPQQVTVPTLHQRGAGTEPEQPSRSSDAAQVQPSQESALPRDVSGEYDFDHAGEAVEIDLSRHKLTGYISRMGDAETDSNTPLTYYFDQSSVEGTTIRFQTRVLHGIWYSFHGTILRGDGQVREDAGYYILHGVLKTHHPQSGFDKSADETIEQRTVNFKSKQQ